MQAAVAVQELFGDRFLAVQVPVLEAVGLDADAVQREVASGRPLARIKASHTGYVASHDVWGVPTFIVGDHAAFIRFMHRPEGDVALARTTIERVVDLLSWPELNEFKHTSVAR
jgi:hypothetical protein